MNMKKKKITLFFTYNTSLHKWKKSGLFEREIKLYNEIAKKFEVQFFTYGGLKDLSYQKYIPQIKILPVYSKLAKPKNSYVQLIQSFLLPIYFKNDLKQKDLAKHLMEQAAVEVVGGIIKVDEERISSNWAQDDKHQEIFDEIFKEIEEYKAANDLTPQLLTTG